MAIPAGPEIRLTDMEYSVLRFKNKEVMENIDEVLEKIKNQG
ncbi:MAG: DUF559 domain-containing protein [Patescibacteria group bacterium]